MNKDQLRNLIVKPLYEQIRNGITGLDAFMMCVAHESKRGEWIRQLGYVDNKNEGAFGLIQMEKFTHSQTWLHGDSIWSNALKVGIITNQQYNIKEHPPVERLIYDLKYNAFMFRQRMFMKPGKLPTDLKELSRYLKQHWNSVLGAAYDMSYYDDYVKW